jgi:hypothetical protein
MLTTISIDDALYQKALELADPAWIKRICFARQSSRLYAFKQAKNLLRWADARLACPMCRAEQSLCLNEHAFDAVFVLLSTQQKSAFRRFFVFQVNQTNLVTIVLWLEWAFCGNVQVSSLFSG